MTRVLLVEEKADLRAVVKDAFGEVGYDVAAVAGESNALKAFGSFRPDLVIFNGDGLIGGAADRVEGLIRRLSRDGAQPVILLGNRNAADPNAHYGALCLSAPLDVDALIVAAAGLLSGELAAMPAALN